MQGNETQPIIEPPEEEIQGTEQFDQTEELHPRTIEGTIVDDVPDEIIVRHTGNGLFGISRLRLSLGAGVMSFVTLAGLGVVASCHPEVADPKHSRVSIRTVAVKPIALDCSSVVVDEVDAKLATQAQILGHDISSIGYTASITGKILELVCAKTALANKPGDPSHATETARTPAVRIVDGPVKDEADGSRVQTKQVRIDIQSLVAVGIMDPSIRDDIEPKFATKIAGAESAIISAEFEALCNTVTLLQARDQCGAVAHSFDSWDTGKRADLDAAAREKVLEEGKDCLSPAWPSIAVAIRKTYEAQGAKPGDVTVVFVDGPNGNETTKTPTFSKEPFSELYKDGVLTRDKNNKPILKLKTESQQDICKIDNDSIIANNGVLPSPSASTGGN